MSLATKKCESCTSKTPAASEAETERHLEELRGWTVNPGGKLIKTIELKNFQQSLELANKLGAIAEAENHHPTLTVGWGRLEITIWTDAIRALSENDFILAAKFDRLMM